MLGARAMDCIGGLETPRRLAIEDTGRDCRARLGGGCICPDSMASAKLIVVMIGCAEGIVGARLIDVTRVPAGCVGAIEMDVTIGDPAIVVTSCATGSDIDIGCAAIVIVRAEPWSTDGRSMLTTGAFCCWLPGPGWPPWPPPSPVAALRLIRSWAF